MTDRTALHQFRTATDTADRERAFADIVRRHAAWLYNAALRQISDPAAAEDAVQATFIVLGRKAARLGDDASLAAWLAGVLRLAVLRLKRDHARRHHHETQAAMHTPTDPADPARAAAWRELAPVLDQSVAELAGKDREAILLRFYRQMTYAQVGAALGLTEDAARKRVDRAVDMLRGTLARRGALTGTSAAVLAGLLWSNTTAVAAPPGLVATATTIALAGPGSVAAAGASTTAAKAILTTGGLLASATVAIAAVALAGGLIAALRLPRSAATPAAATAPSPSTAAPTNAPAARGNTLVGRLADGSVIELLSVAAPVALAKTFPDSGSPTSPAPRTWFAPDGSPMPSGPYKDLRARAMPGAGEVTREFAFNISLSTIADDRPTAAPDFDGVSGWAGSNFVDAGPWTEQWLPDSFNFGYAVAMPDRPATVRFNIAAGPWHPQLTTTAEGGSLQSGDDQQIVNAPVAAVGFPNATEVEVQHIGPTPPDAKRFESRLIATDIAGGQHVGHVRSMQASAMSSTTVYRFDNVAPDALRQIESQTRPRDEWIEFANVSLTAGAITTPVVRTSDDPRRATFRDGTTTDLIAVGEVGTGQWWTPDGRVISRPAWPREEAMGAFSDRPRPHDPATRSLLFITASHASGAVAARSMAAGLPSTADEGSMNADGDGLYRQMTQISLPADADTVTLRTQVGVQPQSVTLRPKSDQGWSADDAVTLTSRGGTTYTLGRPREMDGRASFNATPQPLTREVFDALDFVLLRRGGEAPLGYRDQYEKGAPTSLTVFAQDHTLAEITGVTMTLTRYDHQADFVGVALRPGVATAVGIVVTDPPNPPRP